MLSIYLKTIPRSISATMVLLFTLSTLSQTTFASAQATQLAHAEDYSTAPLQSRAQEELDNAKTQADDAINQANHQANESMDKLNQAMENQKQQADNPPQESTKSWWEFWK